MTVLDEVCFSFDRAEFDSLIRFDPDGGFADEIAAVLERVLPVIKPKAVFEKRSVDSIDGDRVSVGVVSFRSAALARNLSKSAYAVPYVVTCGVEADLACPGGEDPLVDFWVDTVKEMALRAARSRLFEVVGAEAPSHIASMNPGSGDVSLWPLSEQRPLFALLGDVEGAIGVKLLPSMLMMPNKSVSGILFPTEEGWVNCAHCSRPNCPNRRAPEAMPV